VKIEMSVKILVALTLIVLFSAMIYGFSKSNTESPIEDLLLPEDIRYDSSGARGWICRDVKLPDGTIINSECNENTFTNVGVNETAKRMFLADGSFSGFVYIALGNGSAPLATDTTLTEEITDVCLTPQGRQDFSGNCVYVNNANLTCWYQYTTNCNMIINSSGTLNASTNGIFLQGADFADASMQPDWLINVSITREYTV